MHAVLRLAVGWALLGGGVGVGTALRADEINYWPAWVGQTAEGGSGQRVESWVAAGPLGFWKPRPSEGPGDPVSTVGGVRPFYVWKKAPDGHLREAFGLYPFFTYRAHEGGAQAWSFFNLINYRTVAAQVEPANRSDRFQAFDVWPFYFSRSTGDPARDYKAVFPLAGAVKQRFGQDRFSWVLFPLYGRFEKKGVVTTTVPWPFLKIIAGEGHRGVELWPLYGQRGRPGDYRERFLLWPLFYKNESDLSKAQPTVNFGALPFYASDRSEGYVSETWAWPFFGYVDRTAPYRYHAKHYFWPFLVQGEGDERRVNRWAPFYTHSVIKGTDKRWVLWPLWRQARWQEGVLEQTKTQLLFVFYNSTHQRSLTNPAVAPARKMHVWPLFSSWNNGAGRRQVQALSPIEVFFPHNEPMRQTWSPLFALYRYDHQVNGDVRHSLLWDGVTYRRRTDADEREFNLGPILQVASRGETRRVALFRGLVGFRRTPGQKWWRPFFGDFNASFASPADARP